MSRSFPPEKKLKTTKGDPGKQKHVYESTPGEQSSRNTKDDKSIRSKVRLIIPAGSTGKMAPEKRRPGGVRGGQEGGEGRNAEGKSGPEEGFTPDAEAGEV